MNAPVAILAGGLATRLQAVAPGTPKSLVEVAGRPFLYHQLDLLRSAGIRRAVLCLGHQGERIRQQVRLQPPAEIEVDFSEDGPSLLGTAGAIRKALPLLGKTFFVLYGDSYLEMDYAAAFSAFERSGCPALMTVCRNEGRWDRSNALVQGDRVVRYDKRNPIPEMVHADFGLGIFRSEVLETLPADAPTDLADLYAELARTKRLATWEVAGRFYEIGSPDGLAETRRYLQEKSAGAPKFGREFLAETARIAETIDASAVERLADLLAAIRERGGRLFVLGVGGSAANASHAVNDFRKLAGLEAYAPTDNVSELTARTNDEGWATTFAAWLQVSRLGPRDGVLVLSVGGGDLARNVSPNLVKALEFAKSVGASIGGIVGRDGGHAARVADACVLVPTVHPARVTPHTEAFQGVILHLLVSHPKLAVNTAKWEGQR